MYYFILDADIYYLTTKGAVLLDQYINILKEINSCITTLRLYPPENKLVSRNLDQLVNGLDGYFKSSGTRDDFFISMADDRIILNDRQIEDKQRNNPIVTSIQSLFKDHNLKSISIRKGIRRDELISFFCLINEAKTSKSTEKISIQDMLKKKDLKHIDLDEMVYVALGKKDKDSLSESREDLLSAIRTILKSKKAPPDQDTSMDQAKYEMFFADPINTGKEINKIIETDNTMSFAQKSKTMTSIMNNLANFIKEDQDEYLIGLLSILRYITPDLSAGFLMTRVATQKRPVIDADKLILYMDDKRLKLVLKEIESLQGEFIKQTDKLPKDRKALYRDRVAGFIKQLNRYLNLDNEKSAVLDAIGQALQPESRTEAVEGKQGGNAGDNLLQLIKGHYDHYRDIPAKSSMAQVLQSMPDDQTEKLFDDIREIVSKDEIYHENYIYQYAEELAHILANTDNDKETISRIIKNVLSQVDREIELNIWYASLLLVLEKNLSNLYDRKFYDIIAWILLTLKRHSDNDDGLREKEQTYYADAILRKVENDEYYRIVFNFFKDGKVFVNDSYYMIMIKFVHKFVVRVIDLLKSASDMKVRKQAINYLIKTEEKAIDHIINELSKDQPWYVYRNLLIVLGKIGFPSTIFIIKKFLEHQDKRVSKEAVVALMQISSQTSFKILCDSFSDQPDDIKIKILNNYQDPEFIELLEPISRYLGSVQIKELKNKNLLKACLITYSKISPKEFINLAAEIVWGKLQNLLNFHEQEFLLSLIVEILYNDGLILSRDILKKMQQDNRSMIKKTVNQYLQNKEKQQ